MNYLWQLHVMLGAMLFVIGTVVGSFLNVCIYRIPWEKSVIWPPTSHCPNCLSTIEHRDNIPIFGWILLGGKCRSCRQPFSGRYAIIEFLVGLIFVGVYLVDGVLPREYVDSNMALFVKVFYHEILVALLVTITFIDADLTIVPLSVTNVGIFLGLAVGVAFPDVRPIPADAKSHLDGLLVGVIGAVVGGGIIWLIRTLGSVVFRREAMGEGDIWIMALIGSFLGWQAALMTPFLASFVGLFHAVWKLLIILEKKLTGRKDRASDHEIPFGPYLSVAALILMMAWPWVWKGGLRFYFETFSMLFWFVLGRDG